MRINIKSFQSQNLITLPQRIWRLLHFITAESTNWIASQYRLLRLRVFDLIPTGPKIIIKTNVPSKEGEGLIRDGKSSKIGGWNKASRHLRSSAN